MVFYILPEKVEACNKKIALMSKHLANKPNVVFNEPKLELICNTILMYNSAGEKVFGEERYYVSLVKVELEDLEAEGWHVVANVFYQEGVVTCINAKMFKEMPKEFGLKYNKCDYCGKVHGNRKESHIIYNEQTKEWKQVGSACFAKMFAQAKYLANFMESLGKLIDFCGGCGEYEFLGGGWKAPDHSRMQAYEVAELMAVIKDYRQNVTDTWVKSGWDWDRHCKIRGTTDFVIDHIAKGPFKQNASYNAKVAKYVKGLEESEFNDMMKEVFENGFLPLCHLYLLFFAQKKYDDFCKYGGDFLEHAKGLGIVEGEKFTISGKGHYEGMCEGFYGTTYLFSFKDEKTGLTFMKDFSYRSVACQYSDNGEEDGNFNFSAVVGSINVRTKVVSLRGRCSKVKPNRK